MYVLLCLTCLLLWLGFACCWCLVYFFVCCLSRGCCYLSLWFAVSYFAWVVVCEYASCFIVFVCVFLACVEWVGLLFGLCWLFVDCGSWFVWGGWFGGLLAGFHLIVGDFVLRCGLLFGF